MEVAKAVGLALEDFHFGVKALGDSVVSGEAPHGGDFVLPGVERVAELDERREAGGLQFRDRAQQTRRQLPAAGLIPVFFQQQITEPLLEAVDRFQGGMKGQKNTR